MAAFGFNPSEIDGSEYVFETAAKENEFPTKYSFRKYLPSVINQGESPICVPCSISAFLNWRENLTDGSSKNNEIDYFEIYNNRKTATDNGMTFKDAFYYLRHNGVKSQAGEMKINKYAMVRNYISLKEAIIMNGPCVGALPVYNCDTEFWIQKYGDKFEGYHAVAIVGFDEEGFTIRNSWGVSYGDKGYAKLKYEDINKFKEIWTILS